MHFNGFAEQCMNTIKSPEQMKKPIHKFTPDNCPAVLRGVHFLTSCFTMNVSNNKF
jgi:hypothetical protein